MRRPTRPPGGTITPLPTPGPVPAPGTTPLIPPVVVTPVSPGGPRLDVVLDPPVLVRPSPSNDPLLLLPMRLEYRIVQRNVPIRLVDTVKSVDAVLKARASVTGTSVTDVKKRALAVEKARKAELVKPSTMATLTSRLEDHLWLRWFPDSNFAENGIAAPLPEEIIARDTFLLADPNQSWPSMADSAVNQAWQAFAGAVGLTRAVHLMQSRNLTGASDPDARVGRIAALPAKVAIYALTGETLTLLGEGASIPPNTAKGCGPISYAPHQLTDLEWLTDFNAAVAQGMGVRLTDQAKVATALGADWIFAIGLHGPKAEAEIEALMADRIANGAAEFLPQDTPTNNSPTATTGYRQAPGDVLAETARIAPVGAAAATGAAGLLAQALGLAPGALDQMINAADPAFADAQAMMRVVGPALLDEALDGKTHLADVSETEFLDAMAAAVVARGALSPMRFGDGAYGIATITDLREMEPRRNSQTPRDKVEAFMIDHAAGLRRFYPGYAPLRVPVIAPDDPQASDKLDEILKTNRVSTRIEVGEAAQSKTSPIGCPHVMGATPDRQPLAYLDQLRTQPIKSLPDPDESDRTWPMLYRLARMTLTRNTLYQVIKPAITERDKARTATLQSLDAATKRKTKTAMASVSGLSVEGVAQARTGVFVDVAPVVHEKLTRVNQSFVLALRQLKAVAARPDGAAQLDSLMMETIDLFQHRIDAWAIGLAYSRLQSIRAEARDQSLFAGWYGMISKLRPTSATSPHDGYLQAPTSAHATSAAVMRSAYLRHRADGAFAVNLRSGRANRALKLLDMLRKGLTLSEALGLRGERWLRDNGGPGEVQPLRKAFPLTVSASDPTAQRLFDGLKFVETGATGLTGTRRKLHVALSDDLDAISDLVMAEAVHQRTMGATDAAAAWLAVLSGGSVPGRPAVLRTQRYGHGSDHRVTLLLPQTKNSATPDDARSLADPAFAAMATVLMPDFDQAFVEVTAALVTAPQRIVRHRFVLERDLAMTPMDLVIGGVSEIRARAAHLARRAWMEGQRPFADLGALPTMGTTAALTAEVIWTIDLTDLEQRLKLVERAERLRRIGQQARPMDAADLNAAADPAQPMTEAIAAPIWAAALDDMADRARSVQAMLGRVMTDLTSARSLFFRDAFAAFAGLVAPDDADRARIGASLLRRWAALQTALWDVADFGLPQSLRLESVGDMLGDLRASEARLVALEDQLGGKSKLLSRALTAQGTASRSTIAPVRGALAELTTAIRAALDGEALPLAPVFGRAIATTPLLEPGQAVDRSLADWSNVRKAVRNASDMLGSVAGWQAFPVSAKAVVPPDPATAALPDAEDPPVRHFGLFLTADQTPAKRERFSGFVIDDWTEQRPSQTQDAALAVNYDSPQGEAPNCLLLCVPPKTGAYAWTEDRAAQMVRETVAWMKARALAVHDHLAPPTLRPGMNRIAYKGSGTAQKKRIPEAKFGRILLGDGLVFDASLTLGTGAARRLSDFSALSGERSGFTRIKD